MCLLGKSYQLETNICKYESEFKLGLYLFKFVPLVFKYELHQTGKLFEFSCKYTAVETLMMKT